MLYVRKPPRARPIAGHPPEAPRGPSDPMSPAQRMLGQVLIEMGIVDERKVNEALEYQKRAKPGTKIGQAMIELGFCDETQVTKGLCRQFRLPFVDISRLRIPPAVADLVPKKIVAGLQRRPGQDPGGEADPRGRGPDGHLRGRRPAVRAEPGDRLRPDAAVGAAQRPRGGLRTRGEGRGRPDREGQGRQARARRGPGSPDHPPRPGLHGEGALGPRVGHPRRADAGARPRALPGGRRLLRGGEHRRAALRARHHARSRSSRRWTSPRSASPRTAASRSSSSAARSTCACRRCPASRGESVVMRILDREVGPRRPRQAGLRGQRPRALRADHPQAQRHLPRHRARRGRARRRRSTRR